MNDELFVNNYNNIKAIFSSMGKLKRCGIHWDKAGISKGTADIEYEIPSEAKKAKEFLDGKEHKIKQLGSELEGQKISIEYNN